VNLMLGIMRGEIEAPVRDRREAAEWLADRGWGKAEQTVTQNQTGEQVIRIVRDDGHSKS
jgi:O-methyltransferase involved in polyketide biosynthesis